MSNLDKYHNIIIMFKERESYKKKTVVLIILGALGSDLKRYMQIKIPNSGVNVTFGIKY